MKAIIFLFFFQTFLFAQHPLYLQFTEKDGLPDIEFYSIVEDNQGFIWLGANKGLYRYDGKEFKNYSHPDKRGLSVFGLKFDKQNRLWCNNISGQYFFIDNDSLSLFKDLNTFTRGQLGRFFFHNNKLVVSCGSKLLKVDLDTKEEIDVFPDTTSSNGAFESGDTLFILKDKALRYLTEDKQVIQTLSALEMPKVVSLIDVFKLGDDELVQFSYEGGVGLIFGLRTKNKFNLLRKSGLDKYNRIYSAYKEDDKIWLCTRKGVQVYQYKDESFQLLTTYFKGVEITGMIKDSSQNYWFTTLRNGVYIIPNIKLEKYDLEKRVSNISAMCKLDADNFIYGTTKGSLFIVNKISNKIKQIRTSCGEKVNKIAFNGDNKIYVSFETKGLLIDRETNVVTSNKLTGLLSNSKGMSVINDKKIIFGASEYSEIIDVENGRRRKLGTRRTYATHYNKHTKEIFVAYVDGVEYYDKDFKANKITFKGEPIITIAIDHTDDNTVWVSTFKNGVLGIRNGEVVCNYSIKNGLMSNQASLIKSDGNFLWIVTDKGVQVLNVVTGEFKNLTERDGLNSFNISDILIFEKKLYFSSNKGLFKIDKKEIFKEKNLSEIYFTKISIADKDVELKEEYDLPANTKNIKIQFHINGYLSYKNIRYKYRLLGASNSWSLISEGVNEVVFNSLSSGSYVFELKAEDKFEGGETDIRSIKIKINRPIYKRWWFVYVLLLFLTFIILFYNRRRLRAKEKEQDQLLNQIAKEKEMVFLKLENLRSQMNPHFIFNALNSIQDYILLNEKKLAGDYLGKFADLIRIYLNQSSKDFIVLSEEIDTLKKYLELEKLRFEASLEYKVSCCKDIDIDTIEIPSMLIQPYVENSLKHGLLHKKGKGKLEVSFEVDSKNKFVLCKVKDDGIGRDKAIALRKKRNKYHNSFATKATQDRLELLNYNKNSMIEIEIIDLFSENGKPQGTEVLIKMPYKKY
ncbi:sensor histidine kinase [Tenacibaculum sp. nBUS_03]|uniref:sensor histidine kinase n=1 Tax=Tenacibaculum sp. nBUS_03 TaxID=3395320 RepID=UPI003EB86C2B